MLIFVCRPAALSDHNLFPKPIFVSIRTLAISSISRTPNMIGSYRPCRFSRRRTRSSPLAYYSLKFSYASTLAPRKSKWFDSSITNRHQYQMSTCSSLHTHPIYWRSSIWNSVLYQNIMLYMRLSISLIFSYFHAINCSLSSSVWIDYPLLWHFYRYAFYIFQQSCF